MATVILRYLFFGSSDWDRRQHLVAEDNQPICRSRTVTAEDIEKRLVIIKDTPSEHRRVCQACTRSKAAYLEWRKLQSWKDAAR